MLTRRSLLATAAVAPPWPPPRLARAAGSRATIKFIPQSDLTVLDPIWTTAYVTRNHGLMVFDTLYGTDAEIRRPAPNARRPHHRQRRPRMAHDPPPRPQIPRRHPRPRPRLRREHQALGQARYRRPNRPSLHRRPLRSRRQDHRIQVEKTLSASSPTCSARSAATFAPSCPSVSPIPTPSPRSPRWSAAAPSSSSPPNA